VQLLDDTDCIAALASLPPALQLALAAGDESLMAFAAGQAALSFRIRRVYV
jgi:hypothetical protein